METKIKSIKSLIESLNISIESVTIVGSLSLEILGIPNIEAHDIDCILNFNKINRDIQKKVSSELQLLQKANPLPHSKYGDSEGRERYSFKFQNQSFDIWVVNRYESNDETVSYKELKVQKFIHTLDKKMKYKRPKDVLFINKFINKLTSY
jgi:hypothetical protein